MSYLGKGIRLFIHFCDANFSVALRITERVALIYEGVHTVVILLTINVFENIEGAHHVEIRHFDEIGIFKF